MLKFEKKNLEGVVVRLEPICLIHIHGLIESVLDGDLWKLDVTEIPHPKDMQKYILNAEENFTLGKGITFTIFDKNSNQIVGSTEFKKFSKKNKTVEIGSTFIARSWQRTKINTETKLLMLTYAFEVLKLNRVEFFTDNLNSQSKKALSRLNARQEGLLRNHRVMKSGRIRNSIVYSIIITEWKKTKKHIMKKLN